MEKAAKRRFYPDIVTLLSAITVGIIFIIGFMLLRFPENAGKGVTDGIELCVYTLIPSMFPFMFISTLLVGTGLLQKWSKIFAPLTERIFKLPGVCAPVIFFSMVGGLPVGAKMTEELYNEGLITKMQGQRMLFFCINPGPAFVITGVGCNMLGSKELGLIIYASVVLSSLIIGVLSSFVWSDGVIIKAKMKTEDRISFQQAVVNAVTNSGRNMLTVCTWVILFSCLTELIQTLDLSENTKSFLFAVTEITNGCKKCSGSYPIPLIAGIIGFSGLCAQMQVMSSVLKLKLELKYFLSARILNAGFSVLLSMALLEMFPVAVSTGFIGTVPEQTERAMSYPICIGVMAMCLMLLLGDNYRIKKSARSGN